MAVSAALQLLPSPSRLAPSVLVVCLLLLCPFLASSLLSTPIEESSFVWLPSSNVTVGKSANPGSSYLVLTLPLVIPANRAYLYLTNLSPHPITLEWNDVILNTTTPLTAGQFAGYNVDNCSMSARHTYAVWVGDVRVAEDSVSGLCVDCVLNITFTADNRTSAPTVQQPTYALQYRDRDDNKAMYTSNFVSPFFPSDTHPVLVDGEAASLALNFTFVIPILSFNFYPTSILRLLPSSSSVTTPTLHSPAAAVSRTYTPPLLHIPYYYTDILNPSGTFQAGVVLTVIGGFSINPLDFYCCYMNNANTGYYSECGPTNSSDTFHCTIPKSLDDKGYDGELFTVIGEYQPARTGWAGKGYYMRHLVPSGDDNDNTFTIDKAIVPLKWYDIRGWTMQLIIIVGGVLVIATVIISVLLLWRKTKEKKQHKAMERRAAEDVGDESIQWDADASYTPYALTLASSLNASLTNSPFGSFSIPYRPSTIPHLSSPFSIPTPPVEPNTLPSSDGMPVAYPPALFPTAVSSVAGVTDGYLSPLKMTVKNGRRHIRGVGGNSTTRKTKDMDEPLLYGTSI